MNKQDIIDIGTKYCMSNNPRFSSVDLYISEDGISYRSKFLGLHEMFTVDTQHTYGTPSELYFILGAVNILSSSGSEISYNIDEEIIDDMVEKSTIKYMKDISNQFGLETQSDNYKDLYNEMDKSSVFDCGNYFYWYRKGKYMYFKLMYILQNNQLIEWNE